MLTFTTLFDSGYLDKGLALYGSLERTCPEFTLYIFCFDDRSYQILNQMQLPHAVILPQSCFETPALLEKKAERSRAEYCWTCTSVTIRYVLEHYPVDSCTYLDSDLYFFSNPQLLFDEIAASGKPVCIVEHRFKDDEYGRGLEQRNGKYCVEFNYFANTPDGRRVLDWWEQQCFDWCYDIPEPDRMGDQKYLEQFPRLFPQLVHVLQYNGGGVAPWNLEKYRILPGTLPGIRMQEKTGGEPFELVFYHFQNIRYLPGRRVNIKSQTGDKALKYAVYLPYLKETERLRGLLAERYGLDFSVLGPVRSSNPVLGFLQRHFAAMKVRRLSDLLNLDRLDQYAAKYAGSGN